MGFRFHQSFSIIPGLRLNVSKSGLSASIGGAPFTLNVSQNGLMGTVSIPGTGLSYRHHFGNSSNYAPPNGTHQLPGNVGLLTAAPVEQIHSANAELLTSASLQALKDLIQTASKQYNEISSALGLATDEKIEVTSRYDSWNQGYLLKRMFRKTFEKRRQASIDASENVQKLDEQLRQSKIATHVEIDKEQGDLFDQVVKEFTTLCGCKAIWDVRAHQTNDMVLQRTTAGKSVERERVRFDISRCDLIDWNRSVPHLKNSKGGDLYLYPGFVLYRAAGETFSLLDHHDVRCNATDIRYHEEDALPSDAEVVGQTWAKSNKDGSPDRRFSNNYQIPVVRYGSLEFSSSTGLREEFHVSNVELAERFSQSWQTFRASLAPISSPGLPDFWSIHEPSGNENLDAATAFANESEEARKLASEQEDFWRFALCEQLLRSKLKALESEYAKFDQTLLSIPKRALPAQDFAPWIGQKISEIGPLGVEIAKCFENDVRESFGKPEESADPVQILKAVTKLVGLCRLLLKWELEVCSVEPPAKMRPVRDALRGMTGWLIGDLNRVTDELARAIADVRGGSKEFRVEMVLSSPPPVMRFHEEIEKINKNPSNYFDRSAFEMPQIRHSPNHASTVPYSLPICPSSESEEHSAGSISDRVNAARLMESLFTQQMGRPHKAELMGPESTVMNLLCPDPAPIANAYDSAPPTLIRKLKLAGFTTIILSDQSGQSFRVVDLTK
jgi:Protein of unknown function (DUF4236)